MVDHKQNRLKIVEALIAEIVGPFACGDDLDCSKESIKFETDAEAYKPYKQAGSHEEILQREIPRNRYGAGVLFPQQIEDVLIASNDDEAEMELDQEQNIGDELSSELVKLSERLAEVDEPEDDDSLDLFKANTLRPSSMGFTFLAEINDDTPLVVTLSAGRYRPKTVQIKNKDKEWWLRSPVRLVANFSASKIVGMNTGKIEADVLEKDNLDDLDIHVESFVRRVKGSRNNQFFITVCAVNRSRKNDFNAGALYQTQLTAGFGTGENKILPYHEKGLRYADLEGQGLALLYRNAQTFAIGHGCGANWDIKHDSSVDTIRSEIVPVVQTPSITPAIARRDKSTIEVSMARLAGLVPGKDGFDELQEIIDLYNGWIREKRDEVSQLQPEYLEAANQNLEQVQNCLERMKFGIEFLRRDPLALLAFRLANHAILLQQKRGSRQPRLRNFDKKSKRLGFMPLFAEPDLVKDDERGKWRPFQVAFILTTIESSIMRDSTDREAVELIWFPTGGGKTEAYLGLTAFSSFYRRLKNPEDVGVDVLMRYTLRLLTAQQFQRASSLICAMEYLRTKNSRLGSVPFSIGIWLGSATTPNKRKQALESLGRLLRGDPKAENPFVIRRCPWCHAQMGPQTLTKDEKAAKLPCVLGYEKSGNTVVFKCPDPTCIFRTKLPIYVIDEDMYEACPTLVIGTVDKYAMLALLPEARRLFGIDEKGSRFCSPPNLIIQDELHLIAGPLGAMFGIYEALIEELCTDRRYETPIVPKIVSSTATIRRYEDQINFLFGRSQVNLFPPPGITAGDSFFAQYARDPDTGKLLEGTVYAGVHAPGLGSAVSAQVRAVASLMQAPVEFSAEDRDPWWSLLMFFNNLKDLGTSLSSFQSRVPDYMRTINARQRQGFEQIRRLYHVRELTGRLQSEDVPAAIADLEVTTTNEQLKAVDVCLASNIIEVGVDIDRLSLMCVVGQPKTTSQYIQVTGRVGRRWWERPGLVVTILSPSRPRDRSHYERFRSYHERLYANVEPTSVTPFCPPVLERALHAVLVAYVRQFGETLRISEPFPLPTDLIENFKEIYSQRVNFVDAAETLNFDAVLEKRLEQWRNWSPSIWQSFQKTQDIPLLRFAGAYASKEVEGLSWPVPTSMRNVDAQCQIEITRLYSREE